MTVPGCKTHVPGSAEYKVEKDFGCSAIEFFYRVCFDNMAHENNGNGADGAGYSLIPKWDGAPQGWRRYRGDVEIWALGTNLEVNYCVAARLVSRLKGASQRVGLRIPREQLQPQRARDATYDDGGSVVSAAAAARRGIRRPTRRAAPFNRETSLAATQ